MIQIAAASPSVAITCLACYGAILVAKSTLAWWYASRYPAPPPGSPSDTVTVCQPILSGDPDLAKALADNVQALPNARFIWLIDDDDPEAARIARSVSIQWQRRVTVMIFGAAPEGTNPKLFKLEAARRSVTRGILVVLDDDTRLTAPSLAALVDSLTRSELATGLPFYRDASNLYGRLLSQFVNNNSALTYLALLPFVPPVSINGMCYAMNVEWLSRMDGFTPLFRHLTDDLAMAERVRSAGGRITQTPFPQEVATTLDTLPHYVAQMHRWYVFALLLMRRQGSGMRAAIFLLCGLPPLLLVAAAVAILADPTPLALSVFGALVVGRALILSGLQRRLSGIVRHRPVLSLISELLQPLHLMHALCVRRIRWRSRRYRVFDNDHFISDE